MFICRLRFAGSAARWEEDVATAEYGGTCTFVSRAHETKQPQRFSGAAALLASDTLRQCARAVPQPLSNHG